MADATPSSRFVSTIGFPYMDLEDAIGVAKTMLGAGGVSMDRDQLAAAMGQVPTSGNFNMKAAAARWFGLIDFTQGRFQLTPLGFDIFNSSRERAAKATAFLNVPLYRKVFDTFRGRQLPPRPIGPGETPSCEFGVVAQAEGQGASGLRPVGPNRWVLSEPGRGSACTAGSWTGRPCPFRGRRNAVTTGRDGLARTEARVCFASGHRRPQSLCSRPSRNTARDSGGMGNAGPRSGGCRLPPTSSSCSTPGATGKSSSP